MYKIILLGLVLCAYSGCTRRYSTWKLQNGKVVTCDIDVPSHCGINLYGCNSGEDHLCQQNIMRYAK